MSLQNQITEFLAQLEQNNDRQWFLAHKERYDFLRLSFEETVMRLISGISEFDEEIKSVQAKDCLFRIYRDVRFSPDKSPYKNHMGAYIAAQGGRKSKRAGYYLHFEPGNSMLTGGIWMPDPQILKILRQSIHDNADEFIEIIEAPDFRNCFGSLNGRKLQVAPRPYAKNDPCIELMKYKDYTAGHLLSRTEMDMEDFIPGMLHFCRTLYPLNRFLNYAIDEHDTNKLNF